MNSSIAQIIEILREAYPRLKVVLNFRTSFELLVATILSAQCTDTRVNKVTADLFKKYKTVKDFAQADLKELEQDIRSTGFDHNKAKSIIGAAKIILENFRGIVPDTMPALLTLPGVARKTANVVLYSVFGKNYGLAVDTHVKRVAPRLGLSQHTTPEKIEQDLMKTVPQKNWGELSLLLIKHGREICVARKALCPKCVLNKICPSYRIFYA
jgi:endonuclease-3